MLTVENEYFIRLLLLIFKGGTSVLRQVLTKRLEDSRVQLSAFLYCNKEQIDKLKEDKVLTFIQYNVLFPSNGKVTDLGKYDISLLSCLLLNTLSSTLKQSEVKAIENIRTLRNELPAHHPNDSIDVRTFFRKWNHLHQSISNLAIGLTDEQRLTLENVVMSVGEDPIDIKHAIQDIKDATGNIDQFIEHVSQQLGNLSLLVHEIRKRQEETCEEIKELQQKRENRNTLYIIIGEITVSSENPEVATAAAKILMNDAKKCLGSFKNAEKERNTHAISSFDFSSAAGATNAESKDKERMANGLVQDINDAGGAIVDITEGSVLLHIQCDSIPIVSHVVNYFQSCKIEQRLNDIAQYLKDVERIEVHFSANIKQESLQDALCFLQQDKHQQYTTKVRLAIKCKNADGVLNIVKVMEGKDMTKKMTAISNDLSNMVGRSVTLISSVDKDPLQQYIVEKIYENEDKAETEKCDDRSNVSTAKIRGMKKMWFQPKKRKSEKVKEPPGLRKEPWRKLETGGGWSDEYQVKLLTQIIQSDVKEDNVPYIRILLIGHIQAGKSSFLNTIATIDKGRVTQVRRVGSADTSVTFMLNEYEPHSRLKGFRILDTISVESDPCGINLTDVLHLVKGNITSVYRFNSASSIDDESFLRPEPKSKEKIHCVTFVVDANVVGQDNISDEARRKIRQLQERLKSIDVPRIVVLTKIDVLCELVEQNIETTYQSEKVYQAVKRVQEIYQVPEQNIFPVKNYENEVEIDTKKNILSLLAVRQMVHFGTDFLNATSAATKDDE